MITNKQIKASTVQKIRRIRAMGKDVYIHWCGKDHVIQVANDEYGILINAGKSRISINAHFVSSEIGNITLKQFESIFKVYERPKTIADFD